MLDAAQRAAELRGPAPDDPALRPAAAHLHPGAAHAQGRLRALSRLQGDPPRLDPPDSPDVRLRELRRPAVRGPAGALQRPDDSQARGVRRRVHAPGLRDEDEAAARAGRELPVDPRAPSLVSKYT